MAKVKANDFKNGWTIIWEGNLMQILENQFVKPGKGPAFVRTKIKNLRTGSIIDHTFGSDVKVEQVFVERYKYMYLYNDGTNAIFMNNSTFDQVELPLERLKRELKFMLENTEVELMSYNSEILSVTLPTKVTLKIEDCEPGIKGDTVSGGTKTATTDTGLNLIVPLFIEKDEEVIVNTVSGDYVSRA